MTKLKVPDHIKANPILSTIHNSVYRRDMNELILVCGRTGSCKSGWGLWFGDNFDCTVIDGKPKPRFSLDQVTFHAAEFTKLATGKLPSGSVIIWDECGVENDNLDFFSLKSKIVKYVLQTFRYKNYIVIMTIPDFKSVSIGTRRLTTAFVEMFGKTRNYNKALGKFEWVDHDAKGGKDFFKYHRYWSKEPTGILDCFGRPVLSWRNYLIKRFVVPRPRPDLEKPYKEKKERITKEWYKGFSKEIDYMQSFLGEKGVRATITLPEAKQKLLSHISELVDEKGRVVSALVEEKCMDMDMDISVRTLEKVSRLLNIAARKQGLWKSSLNTRTHA